VTAVLDAAAVLALLFNEPGADTVAEHIAAGATMSTVNLSEVATILIRHGRDPDTVLDPLQAQVDILAFTDSDAIATAQLYPLVSAKGLSLGDRACLALSRRLNAPAVTAEHVWADLNLDIRIDTIRTRQH
jgi:ribonuclease VapC